MPKSEKYNDGENDVRSKRDLVKELNEILSIENAAPVRIASRIDRTPIQEVKRILKRNLIETNTQKIRLQGIIKQFGEEPTSMKADLSFVSTNNITTRSKNNHPENTKIGLQNMSLKHSLPEKYEMEQIRQDFAINHDELVAYESLIGKIQKMNIPHQQENISLLEKSMKEVESMVYWYKIHTPLIIDNLWPKVIHTSIKRGKTTFLITSASKFR